MKIRRFLLWIMAFCAGGVIAVVLLLFGLAGEIYEYTDTVDGIHLPPVNAIVCLAGGRGRIAAAGDLWAHYQEQAHQGRGGGQASLLFAAPGGDAGVGTPILYISGMGPHSTWSVFARHLRAGVRELIRPENVVLEVESANTEANALFLARYAAQKGWRDILLVTSSYHMKRATLIFERVLSRSNPPVKVHTMSYFQEPFESGEWRSSVHSIDVTITEYVKGLYYRLFWQPD